MLFYRDSVHIFEGTPMLQFTNPAVLEAALNTDFELELDAETIRRFQFGLTTTDNPFDLFTNFQSWWNFDHQLKHKTSELLAATATVTSALGENVEKKLLLQKMQDLVRVNASGKLKIVVNQENYVDSP